MLGGPKQAVVLVGGGLLVAGGGLYAGGQQAVRFVLTRVKKHSEPCPQRGQTLRLKGDLEITKDCVVRSGGDIRIVECDGDAVIIEVLGRDDNPHVVSGKVLSDVSDYPKFRDGAS